MKRLAATYAVVACAPPIGVSPCRNRAVKKEQPAMVYGAIDLHMRYSQIRVIDAAGAVVRDQRVPTTRETAGDGVCGGRPGAGGARGRDRKRVGGWGAGGGGARGDRGRSELRADVWGGAPSREDRPPRRDGAGRSESARVVSRGASRVGGAAGDAPSVTDGPAAGADAEWRGGAGACVAATGRLSAAVVRGRAGPGAAPVAGAAGAAHGDAGAAGAADHRDDDGDRRARGGAAAARRARSRHAHAADGPRGRADRGVDLPGAVG